MSLAASTSYEARLRAAIGTSWAGTTPGLRLRVHSGGRLRADVALGQTYPIYDWASLTKVVFSTTAAMMAVESGRLRLSEPVSGRLPFFDGTGAAKATVASLLSHTAGLTWWEPFYQSLDPALSRSGRWSQMRSLLGAAVARSAPPIPMKAVYSDLDFLSLGFVLEDALGASLLDIWRSVQDRLGLAEVDFHVDNRPTHRRADCAPTEDGTPQGVVHDENARALGGVAPHAGLFGGMDDLSRYGLALRAALLGKKVTGFPRSETVVRFARRAVPRSVGDWALGFMMPSKVGSSAGSKFSPRSVGHTGFTGTSLWLDPRRDLLVTILSNRIHPTRANNSFVQLRGRLHTWCVEAL